MTRQYVGALDSGTTSTRFMVFDRQGQAVIQAQKEHAQIFPAQGWVEHDPMEIWKNVCEVIRAALQRGDLTAQDFAAIGITNQRETTVIWERKTGLPVYNAVVWQDVRTAGICAAWQADGLEPEVSRVTGLPISPYFSASKIHWILDHIAEGWSRAQRGELCCGTIDTWLLWHLTADQRFNTDVTNASRTMYMDLQTLAWDPGLLQTLGIPECLLPDIQPSSHPEAYGCTSLQGPLAGSVPIGGVLGDQQAATVGQTCFSPGEAKNTYGTGCFVLLNTGREIVRSQNGLVTTVAYAFGQAPPAYALEGSIAMGGATIQWLRDEMAMIATAAESEEWATRVPDSGGCYLVPAFSGLLAPHWRSDARGVLVGLTRYVTKAHVVRAALEAICYQSREVLDAMQRDSGMPLASLHVDGGATANDFLMQLQADIQGVEVVRPRCAETTSLGAAYAAGLAVGYWSSLTELRENYREDHRWQPRTAPQEREAGYRQWRKAVVRTLDWTDPNSR